MTFVSFLVEFRPIKPKQELKLILSSVYFLGKNRNEMKF